MFLWISCSTIPVTKHYNTPKLIILSRRLAYSILQLLATSYAYCPQFSRRALAAAEATKVRELDVNVITEDGAIGLA